MSRIGKKIITVPAGVKVAIAGPKVQIDGPKGKLSLNLPPQVKVTWAESEKAIKVELAQGFNTEDRAANANWGSTRAHLRNMVEGVTKGYEEHLQVVGTGWSATLQGKTLKLVLGFSNTIEMVVPDGITVVVEKAQGDTTPVKISGSDRQMVGQFASAIRQKRKPEPYNGKGVKYASEVIKRKQGKQFGA